MKKIGAIVLTGGKSSRMGRDKASLPLGGQILIDLILAQLDRLCSEVMVVGSFSDECLTRSVRFVADERPDCGPLMGIVSGLKASASELNLVVACDIPVLNRRFLLRLIEESGSFDIFVPRYADGRCEPLLALYSRRILPIAQDLIDKGEKKIDLLFARCNCGFLDVDELPWLMNINTPDDYADCIKKFETNEGSA